MARKKPNIRKATHEDVDTLVENMREADVLEVTSSSGMSVRDTVEYSFKNSSFCMAGTLDDELVCLFGVAPEDALAGIGVPWMLGTDLIEKNAIVFLRRCKPVVERMAKSYPVLHNNVDARNKLSKRWLKWLGFTVGDPEPFGPNSLPFHPFEMRT